MTNHASFYSLGSPLKIIPVPFLVSVDFAPDHEEQTLAGANIGNGGSEGEEP
jgi:hypothetical protein